MIYIKYLFCIVILLCQEVLGAEAADGIQSLKDFIRLPLTDGKAAPVTVALVEYGCHASEVRKHQSQVVYQSPTFNSSPMQRNRSTHLYFEQPVQLVWINSFSTFEGLSFQVPEVKSSDLQAFLQAIAEWRFEKKSYCTSFVSPEHNIAFLGCSDDTSLTRRHELEAQALDELQICRERLVTENERGDEEKYQECLQHGSTVLNLLLTLVPDARVKLYHPDDLSSLAEDQEVKIVNLSAGETHGIIRGGGKDNLVARRCFRQLMERGKLLIRSLKNNDEPVALAPEAFLFEEAKSMKEGALLLCAAGSYFGDNILGPVSQYLRHEDVELMPHYITAPGFALKGFYRGHILNKETPFIHGASYAATCVTAAAAFLLAHSPKLPVETLAKVLVLTGRKPSYPLPIPENNNMEMYAFIASLDAPFLFR